LISASKTTFNHYNLTILRPKVTNNLTNLPKKFCESRPWLVVKLRSEKRVKKLSWGFIPRSHHKLYQTIFLKTPKHKEELSWLLNIQSILCVNFRIKLKREEFYLGMTFCNFFSLLELMKFLQLVCFRKLIRIVLTFSALQENDPRAIHLGQDWLNYVQFLLPSGPLICCKFVL